MKKTQTILMLLAVSFILPTFVFAEETNVATYDSLLACVDVENSTCKLTADIDLEESLVIGKTTTIDLNGHTIMPKEGISLTSTGIIWVNHGGTLTVNDSVGTGKIDGDYFMLAIQMAGPGDTANAKKATLVVNGGTIKGDSYAISGNGNPGRDNTSVTINGGKLESNSTAIFQPQNGILTVNGGTITGGKTGIEVRAGKITVNGGTITGNGGAFEVTPNGNGTTTTGAGIAIVQHTTALETTAIINGGTINGYSPLHQTTPEEENDVTKISLTINGGTFNVIDEGTSSIYSEDFKGFITGGTFSTDVTKYIATGVVSKKLGNVYVVATENKVNVTEVTNGTVTVDKTKAIVGEEVTITVTPNEGYEITTLKVVDADNKELTITDNKFVMPNGEVTVTATLTKVETTVSLPTVDEDEEVEEVTVGVTNAEKTEEVLLESLTEALKNEDQKELADALTNSSAIVEVEIANVEEDVIDEEIVSAIVKEAGKATIATYFDISVAVKNASDGNTLGNISELTKEIELAVLLPEDLKNTDKDVTRKYYVIRRHVNEEGKVEIEKLDATLSKDGKSLTFKTDKFSTYALAYEDIANEVPESPKTLDNIGLYIILGMLSLIAFASIVVYRKKRYN